MVNKEAINIMSRMIKDEEGFLSDNTVEAHKMALKALKTVALLEKTYADFCGCEGGEGWLKIDGKEYNTDVGYAIEGMRIFMEVFKQRLAESEG